MVLNTTTLPRVQLLKGSIPLAHIARVMCWVNIILSVGALWLAWAWLQGYLVVKGKASGAPGRDRWVNGFLADMANVAITLKNDFIVYFLNDCAQFSSFAVKIVLSLFLRIGFAPRSPALSVCFFGFYVVSRIILLVLAVFIAVILSISWSMFSVLTLCIFASFALRVMSRKPILMCMKFIKGFFNLTDSAKSVAWAWNWFRCWWMERPFTICSNFALCAIGSSSIFTSRTWEKCFKGFFDTAFRADSGEDKQGKLNNVLLNSVIELWHSYAPPERCCSLGLRSASNTSRAASYTPHYTMWGGKVVEVE